MLSLCSLQPARKATEGLKELFIHPPAHCVECSTTFAEQYDHDANVFHGKIVYQPVHATPVVNLHKGCEAASALMPACAEPQVNGHAADLVAARMRMFIFYEVPWRTKVKTILAPLMGSSTEAVMAPAVADCSKLGYQKLYRLLLDHVSYSTCAHCRFPQQPLPLYKQVRGAALLAETPGLSLIAVRLLHAGHPTPVALANSHFCHVTEQEGDCKGAACSDQGGEFPSSCPLHAWQGQDGPAHHAHPAAVRH